MNKKIIGKNVFIRPINIEDVNQKYLNWLNDKDVNFYLETRHKKQNIKSINEYVLNAIKNRNIYMFAICLNNSLIHIGNIKLGPVNEYHNTADISYFLGDKKFWGRGLASEAVKLITSFAFNDLGLDKCNAGVYESNIASSKVLEKAGYTREGCIKSAFKINNLDTEKRENHILFGILKKDFN